MPMTLSLRHLLFCACGLGGVCCTSVLAQLAPGAVTGAINAPTADVLNPGTVGAAWNSSNPERPRVYPGVGGFGSLNLGFGVLPGLELVGRLAYDGDFYCSQFVANPPCQSAMRDLSASVKYQLPLKLGRDVRLAVGAIDIGGAATNFRSYYGVGTASVGAFDLTLGYARAGHVHSSLRGLFGSAQVFLGDHWQATAEYDSRELRAGLRYARSLSERLALEVGASRKLGSRTDQQAWQSGLGLIYSFDKHASSQDTRRPRSHIPEPTVTTPAAPAGSESARTVQPATLPQVLPEMHTKGPNPLTASSAEATQAQRSEQLARRLRDAGFTSIWVGFDDSRHWVVQAEPLAWRKNRLDALGVALGAWQKIAQPDEHLHLVLSYLQDPVLAAQTNTTCLTKFAEGAWLCDGQDALKLSWATPVPTPSSGWVIFPAQGWESWRPQLEIAPLLRQRIGTEIGLYDASLGVSLRWELAMSRGLLWQGELSAPLANSPNFGANGAFGEDRVRSRVESSTLSYQKELIPRFWTQASVGYVMHNDYGAQMDLAWLSPQGDLRLGGVLGYYQGPDTRSAAFERIHHPLALGAARLSLLDGRWFLEAQAGQFYNQDRGVRLASHHWFGDNRLTLHYRDTQATSSSVMPRTKFAGFQISMPIGSRVATTVGSITVRGADQWVYGIESKVGSTNNIITGGYGALPVIRHGLLNDTLDNDRAGLSDMRANLYRVRAMLREIALQP